MHWLKSRLCFMFSRSVSLEMVYTVHACVPVRWHRMRLGDARQHRLSVQHDMLLHHFVLFLDARLHQTLRLRDDNAPRIGGHLDITCVFVCVCVVCMCWQHERKHGHGRGEEHLLLARQSIGAYKLSQFVRQLRYHLSAGITHRSAGSLYDTSTSWTHRSDLHCWCIVHRWRAHCICHQCPYLDTNAYRYLVPMRWPSRIRTCNWVPIGKEKLPVLKTGEMEVVE